MDFTSRYCRRRFQTAMACPSSALGLNCCQFACCIPTIPSIDFPISLHPDWMGNLVQSCPEISLGEMVIPGTHDSGSYSIETFALFSAVGRTQNATVLEQLHRGARFLDLRIAGSGDSISVWHGCLKGVKLERLLEDIHLFCQDFPSEFLIIEIAAERGREFNATLKKKTLELINDTLDTKLYKDSDRKKLMTTPLKELVTGGKQVCILIADRFYSGFQVDGVDYSEEYIMKEYGFAGSSTWMQSKFHNTRDVRQLLEWNLEEVQSAFNDEQFLNNQIILTPGAGGPGDIVRLLLGWTSLQPAYLAGNLYDSLPRNGPPPLHTFFQQNSEENWNLITLDYIDLCPAIISLLIGFNFSPFEILLATVQYGNPNFYRPSMSVTSKVKSHVLREKVLFLNVGRDFGSNFGTLTLAYRVHDKYYSIVVHFDGSSTMVLNEYNHMQAGSREIETDGAEEGNVNPGGGGTVMLWTKTEDGLEFDFDSPF